MRVQLQVRISSVLAAGCLFTALLSGCGGSGAPATTTPPPPTAYTISVGGSGVTGGVTITAAPADNSGLTGGTTPFSLVYNAGTAVTLTAPASTPSTLFSAWTGCAKATGDACAITASANAGVTAAYNTVVNGVALVTVSPAAANVTIGTGQQFTATVDGTGNFDSTVVWSIATADGTSLSPGTISASGLFQTPYPAPKSITVTATSNAAATKTAAVAVTLQAPAAQAGPALSVDATAITHPIDPLIYGMNNYSLSSSIPATIDLPIDRWGGDGTSRYNYLLDVSNDNNDYFFETFPNDNTAYPDVSDFNNQYTSDQTTKTLTLATMPVLGWTTKRERACGFSVAKYGAQKSVDPGRADCGNGVKPDGTNITGNDPTDTSTAIDQTFNAGWAQYLVKRYGTAANGGVFEYALDNEPEYWSSTHRDVHPNPSSYDEITGNGMKVAAVLKAADPTAAVGGPVISSFDAYFYSWKDITTGWGSGPCYCYDGNPTDRLAHGDVAFLDYYLQQFKQYDDTNGVRLLDYLDLHGYYAANNAAFETAGDTALQTARLDSTRAMWDPTFNTQGYTDPTNRTSSPGPVAVELIPRMKAWVAADYPGTKTAITEYNWGGQEHINGALTMVDLLGIFGREGLDMATLWGPPDPTAQVPGLMAFRLYRNYDGNKSKFGDMSLTSTSGNQSQLSVYGAQRSIDGSLTLMVVNKTYGDLTSQLSLAHPSNPKAAVKVFLYSAANTSAIVPQSAQTLTAAATAGDPSTLSMTFPASSVTLLVISE